MCRWGERMAAMASSTPALAWSSTRALRVWRALVAVGFVFLVAHLAFGLGGPRLDGFAEKWVYDALELLAAAGCLLRAASNREERAAWTVLGLGISAFALGDVLYDFLYGGSPPGVSACDAFYLAFYPACYAALALLVRSRISTFNRSLWLDGAIAALAVSALSASIVLQVVLDHTHGEPMASIVALAYPVADLVLLAMVIFVASLTGRRIGRGWAAVGIAFVVITVADSLFLYLNATGELPGGDAARRALAGGDATARRGRVAARRAASTRSSSKGGFRRDAARLRLDRGRRALRRAVSTAQRNRRRARRCCDLHGVRPYVAQLRRERRAARVHADAVADRSADRARKPPESHGRARARHAGGQAGELLFAIFDLNGFKAYNDTFGHPSGDALLRRLGRQLGARVAPDGRGVPARRRRVLHPRAEAGLSGGRSCSTSPRRRSPRTARASRSAPPRARSCCPAKPPTRRGAAARRRADLRAEGRRSTTAQQPARGVLLRVLHEREPELRDAHARRRRARRRRSAHARPRRPRSSTCSAARPSCTTSASSRSPTRSCTSPAPRRGRVAAMRQHTSSASGSSSASPSMRQVAEIVRSTHERWDGEGYPDGLAGGVDPAPAADHRRLRRLRGDDLRPPLPRAR